VTALYSYWKDSGKRWMFRHALKTGREGAKVKCWGRPFKLCTASWSAQSATVERCMRSTTSDVDIDNWVEFVSEIVGCQLAV